MKQLITRVDEALAEAVKARATLAGQSVNSWVTAVLESAVGGRRAWKQQAIAGGRLVSRTAPPAARPKVDTPAGYAVALVSADRDER